MTKIQTLDELTNLRLHLQEKQNKVNNSGKVQIKVAMATCGIASGARDVRDYLVDELEKRSIDSVVTQVGCMGYCYAEPTIEVTLPNSATPLVFGYVDLKKADLVIEKYIKNNELVEGIIPLNYETIHN